MQTNRRNFLKRTGVGLAAGATACASAAVAWDAEQPAADKPAKDSLTISDTTELAAAHLPPQENELSRRCLRVMEKWIPVGIEYFAEWPVRPRCGHFFGGVHWYGLETIGPAETFALASVSPQYDEKAAGVSRAQLREMAIQAVRYLAFTHDTGPAECVRPLKGLGRKENCGTKWGERGKGFFKESQCGSVVAAIGRVCLLLREAMDEETWMMAARIHEDYAQRFGDMDPAQGVYVNTQMEENAWTAAGLTSCCLFLCRHKRAADWEAVARRWMFSTCAAPQDAKDSGLVGARRAASLAAGIFTALPDYWAENHGMVHPSYTASGVRSLMTAGCQLGLWGRDLPPELLWNRRRVYENLKALTDGAGYCQAIQGMDWHYLPTTGNAAPHAVAALLFGDPDAAALERRALRNTELRQEGNGGRMYDKRLAEKTHDQQDPMIMREITIHSVAQLHLFHRLFGPGPAPTPDDELEKRLRGVRVFPHAGFVHHRHLTGQTSFSWRNSIMALPLTREGIYTIAPSSDSWLGRPVVQGRPESHRLVSVRVAESDDAFAGALIMDRCQESLRQQVLFASLPDGRALSWERFLAREDVIVESLDQGFLRITNETFPRLGPNSRGVRTLHHPSGKNDFRGWLGEAETDDVVVRLGRPEWLNVDDRIGLRLAGPGEAIYLNRHWFKPYRAVADDLVLSRLERKSSLRAGQATAPLAALLIPEAGHAETAAAKLSILSGPKETACLATDGYLAAANFEAASRTCVFTQTRLQTIPIYEGVTSEVTGQVHRCEVTIGAGSACLHRSVRNLAVEGHVRIDVTVRGEIHVANIGDQPARVEVVSGQARGRPLQLSPGDIQVL